MAELQRESDALADDLVTLDITSFKFEDVNWQSNNFKTVDDIFQSTVIKHYGDQSNSIKKIRVGKDRKTQILRGDENKPLGILVYKSKPKSEFKGYGISNSLEVKTFLCLSEPKKQRILDELLKRTLQVARNVKSAGIHLTVSEENQMTLNFLKSNDFQIKHQWDSKYIQNSTEYLLSHRFNPDEELPSPIKIKKSITLHNKYITMAQEGKRTIEGRLNIPLFSDIRVNDHIRFFCEGNEMVVKITKREKFVSFRNMFESVGFENCVPDARSLDDAVKIFYRFPGYADQERVKGVLAFKFHVVK